MTIRDRSDAGGDNGWVTAPNASAETVRQSLLKDHHKREPSPPKKSEHTISPLEPRAPESGIEPRMTSELSGCRQLRRQKHAWFLQVRLLQCDQKENS